jgi:DnaJ family protein C protein 13
VTFGYFFQEKEWYYGSADKERNGPVSMAELSDLFNEKVLNARTKVWAQGLEGWRLLHQVPQLKWALLGKGQAVMNESEMASLILSIFTTMCRLGHSSIHINFKKKLVS